MTLFLHQEKSTPLTSYSLTNKVKGLSVKVLTGGRSTQRKYGLEKHAEHKEYERIVELARQHELKEKPGVKVLRNYTKKSKKSTYEDFVSHFNQRFKLLPNILRQRQELAGATAIGRATKGVGASALASSVWLKRNPQRKIIILS